MPTQITKPHHSNLKERCAMNKIQKTKSEKIANRMSENGKIKLGGKLGVDVEVTPWIVKGRGGLGIFFQMPTLLATDIFKKIGEHFKQTHIDQ